MVKKHTSKVVKKSPIKKFKKRSKIRQKFLSQPTITRYTPRKKHAPLRSTCLQQVQKAIPKQPVLDDSDDEPIIFRRPKIKRPHSSPISLASLTNNSLQVSSLEKMTTKESIFSLEYKKNSIKYGKASYKKRTQQPKNVLFQRDFAQAKKKGEPRALPPQVTYNSFFKNKILPVYIKTEFSSLQQIVNFLTKWQEKFLRAISKDDREVIEKIFLEKSIQASSSNSNTIRTVVGVVPITQKQKHIAGNKLQRISDIINLAQLTYYDFLKFYEVSQKLLPPFREFAEYHLHCHHELCIHTAKPQAFADIYSLAATSMLNYKGTLKQFCMFFYGSDGILENIKGKNFLRIHKDANTQIANFLLFLDSTENYVFSTLRSKMIHLSFFQRPRQDRFSKVQDWYKNFLQRSLGRRYKFSNKGAAPPFSKEDLLALLTFIKTCSKKQFPTHDRDFYLFQLFSCIACRTFEATALMWCEVDFDNFHLMLHIIDRKNEQIHGKPHTQVFKSTGAPTCPVHLINQLWNKADKNRPFVFYNARTNKPHTNDSLNALLTKYMKKVFSKKKAKAYTFYSFRTAYAVHMSAANVDTSHIQHTMGHHCFSSTEHYMNKSVTKKAHKGEFLSFLNRKPADLMVDSSVYRSYFSETYSVDFADKLYALESPF